MGLIKILPETVQNKIAAGEVIERPSSVVKELAENAIDAGATQISVELEDGGHRLIRVSDDGRGMDEADLAASLQRHATSKIQDVDDIFRIESFGFRGEALPSIGSVSRMLISSCPAGAAEGREIAVEAGKALRLGPAAPRRGTRVEVRDIFFNTPARRKFLRSPASEVTRASEVLTRLALGNPGVGFRLQAGERIILAAHPVADQLTRIRDLFGDATARAMLPFASDIAEGLAVSGHFARPPASRKNSTDIFILVNRRWIRHWGLARAVADAFQGILPPREYPVAVINLAVDPAKVDVNAHPAKEEVRFEQDRLLIAGVRRAVREALAAAAGQTTFASLVAPAAAAPAGTATAHVGAHSAPAAHTSSAAPASPAPAAPSSFARPGRTDFSGFDPVAVRARLRGQTASSGPAENSTPAAGNAAVPAVSSPDAGPDTLPLAGGSHRVLGQAGGRYILVDSGEGLLLIDPHALHERWNFDRLREERTRGGAPVRLLVPVEMDLSPSEAASAGWAVPALAEYGFGLTLPGSRRLVVAAAPAFVPPAKLENLLRQVLADAADAADAAEAGSAGEAIEAVEAARDRLLASLACRSSVLLKHSLPEGQMQVLLDRFFSQGQIPTCPHGRPTAIRIGWEELGRRFGR